jgi:plastocyanin
MVNVQGPLFVRSGLALLAALVSALALSTTALADASVEMTEGSQSDINSWGFTPPEVTVNMGESITWTNSGSIAHTATATGGQFDTGNLAPGESKSITLSTAGTFAYQCTPHPWMKGAVTILAAAAAAPAPAPAAQPAAAQPAPPAAAAPAAQAQPTPTPLRLATPTPFRFVPGTTTGTTTTAPTTTAPRAGGIPVELAAPLLAAGASALGGGVYILRRGRRKA